MQIIIFTHCNFLDSQSMPRYANMLSQVLRDKNHIVELWTAKPLLYHIPFTTFFKKWFGYIDQFIIFPITVRRKIKQCPKNTLFVFADQALGPWVHLIGKRPHVIHCHDFLALRSALGELKENKVSLSGKIYQYFIKKGFSRGKNFISVSGKTQVDLHKFLSNAPMISEVIYNQIGSYFQKLDKQTAVKIVQKYIKTELKRSSRLSKGYILNVGGNVWYKNKRGVLELYDEWRRKYCSELPLLMIGHPGNVLASRIKDQSWSQDVYILTNVPEDILVNMYSAASVLLFPSLEEGFGWPIAEAMACGCPVITTKKAPMTEVGGQAAFYIPRRPIEAAEVKEWVQTGAESIENVISLSIKEREDVISAGIRNVKRFNSSDLGEQTEAIYQSVLEQKPFFSPATI